MNDETRFKMIPIPLIKVALCVLAFGLLMALRAEVHEIWLRTVVAGYAGGVSDLD